MFDQVQADLAKAQKQRRAPATLDSLRLGLHGFLRASARDRDVQQILLVDGPSVLGWEQWRELEASYGLGAIRSQLEEAMANQTITPAPVEPLAHLLLAVVDESALYVANSDDPERATADATAALDRLLDGLRPA